MTLLNATSDAAVVRRVLGGDRNQFAVLVERHLSTVYGVAYARTGNHADAEDVSQEAFLQALRSLDSLREPRKFEGWIATIARNTAHRLTANRKRESNVASQAPSVSEVAIPDPSKEEIHQLLRLKIDGLDADHREILLLHYFTGKSTKELGTVIGISQDAAKKRLQRARQALSDELLAQLPDAAQPKRSLANQTKTIAGLIGATAVPWKASVSSAALLGGTGLKLAVGASASVALIAGGVYLSRASLPIDEKSVAQDSGNTLASTTEVTALPVEQQTSDERLSVVESASIVKDIAEAETPLEEVRQELRPPSKHLQEVLARSSISIVFEDIHVASILGFMAKTYDLQFKLDPRVVSYSGKREANVWAKSTGDIEKSVAFPIPPYLTDGMLSTVDIRDMTIFETLEHLLYPMGLDFVEEPGFIWISSPGRIKSEIKRHTDERYNEYDMAESLNQTVGLKFESIHLRDILEFMSDSYGINFVVDFRIIEPEEGDHPLPPQIGEENQLNDGESPDTQAQVLLDGMVPYVSLKDIQMRDALTAMLRPLNLAYVPTGEFIVITTPENIARNDFPADVLP